MLQDRCRRKGHSETIRLRVEVDELEGIVKSRAMGAVPVIVCKEVSNLSTLANVDPYKARSIGMIEQAVNHLRLPSTLVSRMSCQGRLGTVQDRPCSVP